MSISALDENLKSHKATIELLTHGLTEKEKEIDGLEQSNAALRKQIISSISNE
jgi:septal ring factor EnvC (AmiA/AmiB activator)